jgi:hypothetical protein
MRLVVFGEKSRLQPELAAWDSDTPDQVLEPGVVSQRVESGIHPDPWYSS